MSKENCDKLKICNINTKATTKITKQRVINNEISGRKKIIVSVTQSQKSRERGKGGTNSRWDK